MILMGKIIKYALLIKGLFTLFFLHMLVILVAEVAQFVQK